MCVGVKGGGLVALRRHMRNLEELEEKALTFCRGFRQEEHMFTMQFQGRLKMTQDLN